MLWFPLALFATLAISAFVISSRQLLKGGRVDPISFGAVVQLSVSGFALMLLPFFSFRLLITTENILLTITVCFLYVLGSATYYTALKHMDASRLVIIVSLDALFTQLTANLFLHEPYSLSKIFGAVVIILSVVAVTLSTKTLSLTFTRYDLLAVINALVYSVTALIDSYLVNRFYSPLSYQAVNFGFTAVLVLLFFPKSRRALPSLFNWRKMWLVILGTASLLFLTYQGTLNAYSLGGEVSRVTPILATQTLMVVLLEFFILKDRQSVSRKVLASILAIAGIYLMRNDDIP